jgi:uncharacterized membrane protein
MKFKMWLISGVKSKNKRLLLLVIFAIAGASHLIYPELYVELIPRFIGHPYQIIFWSGVVELLLFLLFLFQKSTQLAAIISLFFLALIFPANIQHFINAVSSKDPILLVFTFLRLPFQLILFRLVYPFLN